MYLLEHNTSVTREGAPASAGENACSFKGVEIIPPGRLSITQSCFCMKYARIVIYRLYLIVYCKTYKLIKHKYK